MFQDETRKKINFTKDFKKNYDEKLRVKIIKNKWEGDQKVLTGGLY